MTTPIGVIVQIAALAGSTVLLAGLSAAAALFLGQSFEPRRGSLPLAGEGVAPGSREARVRR